MKYSALALLVAASFGATAGQPTVYGKINLAVESGKINDVKESELASYHSRIGVKGNVKLDSNSKWSAVYLVEFKANLNDDDSDSTFQKRNQYVGVKGPMGELVIGRKDTALKTSQGKVDIFGEMRGDIETLFAGEHRPGEALHYASKPFGGGAVFTATYVLRTDTAQAQALENVPKVDGGTSFNDNAYSIAISSKNMAWRDGKVFASVAFDNQMLGNTNIRTTLYGQTGDLKLGGMLQFTESDVTGDTVQGFMVNASYPIWEALSVKAQYQTMNGEIYDAYKGKYKPGGDVWSVGLDMATSKSFTQYISYTKQELDFNPDSINEGYDASYLAVGFTKLF